MRRTVRLERVAAPKVAAVIIQRCVLEIDEQAARATGGRACRLRALRAVHDHDPAGRAERRKEHTSDYDAASPHLRAPTSNAILNYRWAEGG